MVSTMGVGVVNSAERWSQHCYILMIVHIYLRRTRHEFGCAGDAAQSTEDGTGKEFYEMHTNGSLPKMTRISRST
jgi:hypothetical protein